MLWGFALAFTCGALLAALVPALPSVPWLLGGLGACLVMLRWRAWRIPAAFGLGLCWFLVHANWQLTTQWPAARAGELVRVSGVISGLPEQRGQTLRFELRTLDARSSGLPARLEVSWFRPLRYLQPGELHEFELRLQPPQGRLNPAAPDRYRHLFSQRIGGTATVARHMRQLDAGRQGGQIDRLRLYLSERLQAETTGLDAAALFRALGLADRSGMRAELSALLRQTGTAHLLAISGLHVGLVAALFGLLGGVALGPLAGWLFGLDRRRSAVLCGLLAALAYAALAGWTLPTVRALIMLAVAGLALSLRRGIRPQHALLLALLAVLLLDPLAPLAVGFWLSFGAVAVLIWAFAWRPGHPRGGWLGALLAAQLVLAVGLLPLNVGIFQQVIPGALPANLLAVPLVGFWILPWLLLALLLMALGLPVAWLLMLAELGVDVLLLALSWLDGLDWGYQRVASGGLLALCLAAVGALWLIAPPGWPARSLGAFLLLPLLLPRATGLPAEGLRLSMLDVGDGQLIVLEAQGQRILYDTGPGDGEGRDSLSRLLPALDLRARDPILQGVIMARSHRGHAGGLASAAELAPPERVRVAPGTAGRACTAGEYWLLGAYRLEFLHPSPGLPPLGDNSACVVRVFGPGGAVLLSGGVDRQVERRLLLERHDLAADLLVLGAGGHRRGASSEFLAAVQPGWALASVARFDRFGRPHADLRERLDRAGSRLLTTGQCGAITVDLVPGQPPLVRTERGRRSGFWLPAEDCP